MIILNKMIFFFWKIKFSKLKKKARKKLKIFEVNHYHNKKIEKFS